MFMVENLKNDNVATVGQLKQYKESANKRFFLESFQVWNSLPLSCRTLINRSRRWNRYATIEPPEFPEKLLINMNKWVNIKYVATKNVKKCIPKINMP